MSDTLTRRRLLAAVGTAGLALAACSDADRNSGPSNPDTAGRFPIQIEGQLGTVTIERQPSRVVSIGQYRDTDAAVALGVVPLATPDLSTFIPGGIAPWVRAKLDGAEPPELLETDDGPPLERIATLRPDLILGTDRSSLEEEYGQLSQIAPTLSPATGYNKDTWQVTTNRIGTALGRHDQAPALVSEGEAAFDPPRTRTPASLARPSRSDRSRATAPSIRSTARPTPRRSSCPSLDCSSHPRCNPCRKRAFPAGQSSARNAWTCSMPMS